jgi:hypothetical protein
LFATPYLGIKLFDRVNDNHRSTFQSNYGFVTGLLGEAEGLKFWSYWSGQDLKEGANWDNDRAENLCIRLANSIGNGKCLITGYLGHVFCIKEMRGLFKNIRFVYLKRNLVDNAISILKANDKEVFSSKPNMKYSENPITRVSQQLLRIHYLIFQSKADDYIELDFSELISSPVEAMSNVLNSLGDLKISLSEKAYHFDSFTPTEFSSTFSKYSRVDVAQALELQLSTYSNQLFVNEMMPLIND